MFRNRLGQVLGCCLALGLASALAEQAAHPRYETFNGFTEADRAKLGAAKAAAFLDAVNTALCPCGCAKGTLAECRHSDPNCGVSRALVSRALAILEAEPTLDGKALVGRLEQEIAAQKEAQRKALEQAAREREERERRVHSVPLGNSPWKGAKHAKVTIVEFSEFL
jgi:hypothetical protein